MHYAEFAEDEVSTSQDASTFSSRDQTKALLEAIKEYEANKWKVIGQKLNKPAKVRPTQLTLFCDILIQVPGLRTICERSFQEFTDMKIHV